MATATLPPLVDSHRTNLNTLASIAGADLSAEWVNAPVGDAVATLEWLMSALPDLVDTYGSAAATLGADWFDEMRDSFGVRGRFSAVTAELPDVGRTDSLARWGLADLFKAPDSPAVVDLADVTAVAQKKVDGGLQRIIANADRGSVIASAVADPAAKGWRRAGSGKCDFCQMLIGRGSVYKSQATADFKSHDHCGCVAVPVWS